jgi:hypothetical protein
MAYHIKEMSQEKSEALFFATIKKSSQKATKKVASVSFSKGCTRLVLTHSNNVYACGLNGYLCQECKANTRK